MYVIHGIKAIDLNSTNGVLIIKIHVTIHATTRAVVLNLSAPKKALRVLPYSKLHINLPVNCG